MGGASSSAGNEAPPIYYVLGLLKVSRFREAHDVTAHDVTAHDVTAHDVTARGEPEIGPVTPER